MPSSPGTCTCLPPGRAKAEVGAHLPIWLETWYELEALNALANFGYMNPDCAFPDIVSATAAAQQPVFVARGLGHPLLPDDGRVCNDFTWSIWAIRHDHRLEHVGQKHLFARWE